MSLSALYTWLGSPDIALIRSNPVRGVSRPKLSKRLAKALSRAQVTALPRVGLEVRQVHRDRLGEAHGLDAVQHQLPVNIAIPRTSNPFSFWTPGNG